MIMDNRNKPFEVVIIEDDEGHAEIMMFYIRDACENVSIVHLKNGNEAMNYIERIKSDSGIEPNLVMLDLKMPMFDGHEVLQKIKRSSSLRHIPVVIFTTSNAKTDVEEALNNHANSYIVKPIEESGFKDKIRPIINYWNLNEVMEPIDV